jgi:hypothetical protein
MLITGARDVVDDGWAFRHAEVGPTDYFSSKKETRIVGD